MLKNRLCVSSMLAELKLAEASEDLQPSPTIDITLISSNQLYDEWYTVYCAYIATVTFTIICNTGQVYFSESNTRYIDIVSPYMHTWYAIISCVSESVTAWPVIWFRIYYCQCLNKITILKIDQGFKSNSLGGLIKSLNKFIIDIDHNNFLYWGYLNNPQCYVIQMRLTGRANSQMATSCSCDLEVNTNLAVFSDEVSAIHVFVNIPGALSPWLTVESTK